MEETGTTSDGGVAVAPSWRTVNDFCTSPQRRVTVALRASSEGLASAITVIFTTPAPPLEGSTDSQEDALVSVISAVQLSVAVKLKEKLCTRLPEEAPNEMPVENTVWLPEGIWISGLTSSGCSGVSQVTSSRKGSTAIRPLKRPKRDIVMVISVLLCGVSLQIYSFICKMSTG